MFTVTEHSHKLGNVNPRAELHGDEHVLAVDLSVELKGPNTLLDMLDPNLRTAMFRKMNGTEAQGDLMADDPEYLPSRKFPKLGPLKYDYEGDGYTLGYISVLMPRAISSWRIPPSTSLSSNAMTVEA